MTIGSQRPKSISRRLPNAGPAGSFFTVNRASDIINRALGSHENKLRPSLIPVPFFLANQLIPRFNRLEQPLLVDKRQQRDTLPRILLAVQINLKLFRVEIDYFTLGVQHERVKRFGDVSATGGGQNTHELFNRFKWCSQVKVDEELAEVNKVRGKGRVVVWVEPLPRLDALVVILEHPRKAFDVGLDESVG